MADFYLKKGDRLPKIRATLKDAVGAVVDLTGTTVKFRMRLRGADPSSSPKVNASAAIVDATGGVVEYTWAAGDADTAGTYNAEWIVSFGASDQSHPNDRYLEVLVLDRA